MQLAVTGQSNNDHPLVCFLLARIALRLAVHIAPNVNLFQAWHHSEIVRLLDSDLFAADWATGASALARSSPTGSESKVAEQRQHDPPPQVALQQLGSSKNMCSCLHCATVFSVCNPRRVAISLATTANRCRYLYTKQKIWSSCRTCGPHKNRPWQIVDSSHLVSFGSPPGVVAAGSVRSVKSFA